MTTTAAKKIVPSILAVRMDETEYWVDAFLKKYQIKRVWAVYVYNQNHHTHCCEITPSYELHFVEYQFEYEDGVEHPDALIDEIDGERYKAQADAEPVSYYHTHVIDRIPYRRRARWDRERFHILTQADCRKDGFDHDEAIESALEYCRCNQV